MSDRLVLFLSFPYYYKYGHFSGDFNSYETPRQNTIVFTRKLHFFNAYFRYVNMYRQGLYTRPTERRTNKSKEREVAKVTVLANRRVGCSQHRGLHSGVVYILADQ
jgi:hypothetical protein